MIICLCRSIDLHVHILPSDGFPDSVFVEDTLIAIDNTLMLTNPGAISRRKEVDRIRLFLNEMKYEMMREYEIYELKTGHVDGGDVLFTGKTMIAGTTDIRRITIIFL